MPDLSSLFATITVIDTSADVAYFARPIPNFQRHHLAKDRNGNPCLLLSVSGQAIPPIVLQNIALYHTVHCRVLLQDGSTHEGTFSILCLRNADRILQEFFLKINGALLESLGQEPSSLEISNALNRAVELFRALSNPAKKSIQGLWSEVFLIWQSRAPESLIRAWHSSFDDRFDFSAQTQRLEVKSSGSRIRIHRFRLEQLNPPEETRALISSVFVEPAGGGVSIADLVDDIQLRLSNQPELFLRMSEIITTSLGSDWAAGISETFDLQLAEESLRYYDAAAIPSVNPELPPGVSNVSFESNLQAANTADVSLFTEGLFLTARKR